MSAKNVFVRHLHLLGRSRRMDLGHQWHQRWFPIQHKLVYTSADTNLTPHNCIPRSFLPMATICSSVGVGATVLPVSTPMACACANVIVGPPKSRVIFVPSGTKYLLPPAASKCGLPPKSPMPCVLSSGCATEPPKMQVLPDHSSPQPATYQEANAMLLCPSLRQPTM